MVKGNHMKIEHSILFNIELSLSQQDAISFVQSIEHSLSKVTFMSNLQLLHENTLGNDYIRASILINAAMFGQHELDFQSLLIPTTKGARLQALPFDTPKAGWAEVTGEAVVSVLPKGSAVNYDFDITIHLNLPKPERWGGRALLKMVEFTAQRVLEHIAEEFPKAVQAAASEFELLVLSQERARVTSTFLHPF